MQIHLKKTNVKISAADEADINKKILGLLKYYNGIIEAFCEVGRSTEHHQKGRVFRAELDLRVPGKVLRAEESAENVMTAFRHMMDVMIRELIKYKDTRSS